MSGDSVSHMMHFQFEEFGMEQIVYCRDLLSFAANVDLAVASVKVAGYRNNIQLTANVKFNFTFDIEHQKVSSRPRNRLEDSELI